MNFQEFLARKRALALVEHMNTLSEADAQELFDTLDEETVEFVEMVLNESESAIVKRSIRLGKQGDDAAGVANLRVGMKSKERRIGAPFDYSRPAKTLKGRLLRLKLARELEAARKMNAK